MSCPRPAECTTDRTQRVEKQLSLLSDAALVYATVRAAWASDSCSDDLHEHALELLADRARRYSAAYAADPEDDPDRRAGFSPLLETSHD